MAEALSYRESILKSLPAGSSFDPLITLYLTDKTTLEEIKVARSSGVVYAVKLYPTGATTNSQDGVIDSFGKCFPTLQQMAEHNMPLLVHGEGYIAATVTPQHLVLNRNALSQDGLQPHNYYLPVLKREEHRTNSAPHERNRKECACGCAGIYNTPVAFSLYAKVFEEAGVLDKLEAFLSFNGPDFYDLLRNSTKILLKKNKLLKRIEVQKTLHDKPSMWKTCSYIMKGNWKDSADSVLPIVKELVEKLQNFQNPVLRENFIADCNMEGSLSDNYSNVEDENDTKLVEVLGINRSIFIEPRTFHLTVLMTAMVLS